MPFAFGLPGGYEFLVVGFVALLIFGNRLPSVMRSLGQGITEFKKGVNGIEDETDTTTTPAKTPTA
ncbi:Sec-independent protein translocase subunit TatA/TatB [Tundrisphaera sp. TA3]|uniref:Sec-independent protein translocase subunit TatA/TatB n=1 Tax=Tundrisphaera sp. TA3 TaxID=3435775 RepID=UPI003EC0D656